MAIASLRVPISALPSAAGSQSWLGALNTSLGGALDQASQNKSFNRLADEIGGAPITGPQPGFLARLFGAQAQPAVAQAATLPAPGAASQIAATAPGGGDYYSAIRSAESGGNDSATNPKSSAAGRYQFTSGTWDGLMKTHPELGLSADGRMDPSQQEVAIRAFTQDNAKQLSSSGIPVTPANLYAAHFLGAGGAKGVLVAPDNSPLSAYVEPSVVAANPFLSNMSVADFKKWTAQKGGSGNGGYSAPSQVASNGPMVAPPDSAPITGSAIPPVAGQQPQVASAAPAGVDPSRFASGPVAQGAAGLATALGAQGDTTGQAPYVDPEVTTAFRDQPQTQPMPAAFAAAPSRPAVAPQQVAQAGPTTLAAGVTPVPRGGVSTALIQSMLRDPNLRQAGLQLWQQNATGKTSDGWDFVKLDDGTLARANKQTGEVQSLGNFQSSKKNFVTVGKSLYNADTGEWVTPPAGAGGDDKEFFGTTVPYYDAKGQLHYRQLAKDGNAKDLDFGPGATAAPPTRTIDTGTELVTVGPGGQEISRVPKQNLDEARDKAVGGAEGKNIADAKAALPQIESAANQMLATIDSLDSDPYLPKMLGPVNSRLPTFTADGERVKSKMDQIGGQSFLQAYNTLRGGGQITEVEGAKATAAMGRLNTAQNETDYRQALKELRDIVSSGIDRARQKAAGASAAAPSNTQTKTGISWKVEE